MQDAIDFALIHLANVHVCVLDDQYHLKHLHQNETQSKDQRT